MIPALEMGDVCTYYFLARADLARLVVEDRMKVWV